MSWAPLLAASRIFSRTSDRFASTSPLLMTCTAATFMRPTVDEPGLVIHRFHRAHHAGLYAGLFLPQAEDHDLLRD